MDELLHLGTKELLRCKKKIDLRTASQAELLAKQMPQTVLETFGR